MQGVHANNVVIDGRERSIDCSVGILSNLVTIAEGGCGPTRTRTWVDPGPDQFLIEGCVPLFLHIIMSDNISFVLKSVGQVSFDPRPIPESVLVPPRVAI